MGGEGNEKYRGRSPEAQEKETGDRGVLCVSSFHAAAMPLPGIAVLDRRRDFI